MHDLKKINEWLGHLGSTVSAFLNKHVDIIISDQQFFRKATDGDDSYKQKNNTRSASILDMAQKRNQLGSSSIGRIASKWNIKVFMYTDILKLMKSVNFKVQKPNPTQTGKSSNVKSLRAPFIKVEDQSRLYRPLYKEFKSFPYLDFETVISSTPFDKWFRENNRF